MSLMPALWEEHGMMAPAAAIAAQPPLHCLVFHLLLNKIPQPD